MKAILIGVALTGAIVSGCATQAPGQNYRPPGSVEAAWQIDGVKRDNLAAGPSIDISINGEPVMSGDMSLFGQNVEMRGDYEGRAVSASCSTRYSFFTVARRQCIVFVENERAATLQF